MPRAAANHLSRINKTQDRSKRDLNMYASVGKESTDPTAGGPGKAGRPMDGRIAAETGRIRADLSTVSLHGTRASRGKRDRSGPEWEYLHFLAIMDFLLRLRRRGSVQKSFLGKAAEARRQRLRRRRTFCVLSCSVCPEE